MPVTSAGFDEGTLSRESPVTPDLEPDSGYTGTYPAKTSETIDKKISSDSAAATASKSIPAKFKETVYEVSIFPPNVVVGEIEGCDEGSEEGSEEG